MAAAVWFYVIYAVPVVLLPVFGQPAKWAGERG